MKKTFKKSMAVFMTAMIMLSCWVWGVPTQASAANHNISVYLEFPTHREAWLLNGAKSEENDYSPANIVVSVHGQNGEIAFKTVEVVSNSNGKSTVNISTSFFPREVKFEYAYLTETSFITGSVGGFEKIYTKIGIDSTFVEYVINEQNTYIKNKYSYVYHTGILGVNVNTSINYVSSSIVFEFPSGYDFYEDSYSFTNYRTWTGIDKKFFTTMYGNGSGKVLYEENKNASNGGLCFGMAYTAGAIFNGQPDVSLIKNGNTSRASIKEIKKTDKIKINGGEINIDSYIKYAYIFQWSRESELNNLNGEDIGDYTLNTALILTHKEKDKNGNEKYTDWHAALIVGHAEVDYGSIYFIYDSNSTKLETLTFMKDGRWFYSGSGDYTSENSAWSLRDDINLPYLLLRSGSKATPINNTSRSINLLNEEEITEYCVEGMDIVNKDKLLLAIKSDDFDLSVEDVIDVSNVNVSGDDAENDNSSKLYWINGDKSITISNITGEKNTIKLAGDETILMADVTEDSIVTMTIDDKDIGAEIETETGKEYTLSFETITTDEEYNEYETNMIVSGTASSDTVTATQTDTGLLVTGISDGTVTLTKDEEVIATEEIKDAIGDIEITYDKEGESEDLDAEYHSHSYESAETKNVTCKDKGTVTYTCSCGDTYIEEIEINPDNHIGETEVRNVVNSTCTAKGYTGDTYCLDCGEKITEGKVTDIKGHKDADRNYSCDECGATLENNCSHMCHKTGFMGFIWKILRIFFKLFGSQPVCSCGIAHYQKTK